MLWKMGLVKKLIIALVLLKMQIWINLIIDTMERPLNKGNLITVSFSPALRIICGSGGKPNGSN